MSRTTHARPALAIAAAAALTASIAVAAPAASVVALECDYQAYDEASLQWALDCAASDGMDSTVTVTGSFTVEDFVVYEAQDGALTIEGQENTITIAGDGGLEIYSEGGIEGGQVALTTPRPLVDVPTLSDETNITMSDLEITSSEYGILTIAVDGWGHLDNVHWSGLDSYYVMGEFLLGLTVVDSTFVDNWALYPLLASFYGGSVTRSWFEGNATGYGAVYFQDDFGDSEPAEIIDSSFIDNTDNGDQWVNGAGAAFWGISAIVSGSTFSGNSAANGGAVYLSGESFMEEDSAGAYTLDIVNSTFADNVARYGGAIAAYGAFDASIAFSTFSGNVGEQIGGSFSFDGEPEAFVSLFASVIEGEGCEADGTDLSSLGYNYVSDSTCLGTADDTDTIGSDAMLGALAENGGSTDTMLPQTGSPLIDAIPFAAASLLVDQRGFDRPQADGFDIGAVEVEGEAPEYGVAFVVPTPEGDVTGYATCAVDAIEIGNTPAAALAGTPAKVSAVLGGLSFTIELAPGCEASDITLDLPRPVNSVFKVDGSTWTDMTDALSADGLTVAYTAVDGGAYDQDGTADGWIVDPVVPALEVGFTG